jgi:branched-subunit amino acid aminotransferase/4-amino-4-deoxychorismate lyase
MNTNFPIFFESILFYKGQFPFLHLHLERIQELAVYLRVDFEMSQKKFEGLLRATLKDGEEQKLRVKLNANENKIEIVSIESELIKTYSFNQYPAIKLTIYPNYCKPRDGHSLWKYENPFIYRYSMEYAREKGAAQAILLNENGDITETSLSNFFYIINDKIYTPPLSSGSVNGVYRRYLMSKINVIERNLNSKDLDSIQECFITSAIRGIVPIDNLDSFHFSTASTKKMRMDIVESTRF